MEDWTDRPQHKRSCSMEIKNVFATGNNFPEKTSPKYFISTRGIVYFWPTPMKTFAQIASTIFFTDQLLIKQIFSTNYWHMLMITQH